jgi:hypothetical protein
MAKGHFRRAAGLRLAIIALAIPAALFWRFAAWRARLETELANLEAAP